MVYFSGIENSEPHLICFKFQYIFLFYGELDGHVCTCIHKKYATKVLMDYVYTSPKSFFRKKKIAYLFILTDAWLYIFLLYHEPCSQQVLLRKEKLPNKIKRFILEHIPSFFPVTEECKRIGNES